MITKLLKLIKIVYQNYFEIASCLCATFIILIALLLDNLLNLNACPLCILIRYIFGLIALISLVGFFIKKLHYLVRFLILSLSIYGIVISSKLIYLQNLSFEEIALLTPGCDMPLATQIEYFGLFEGLANVYKGGPSCASEVWRFIFNFAEWGLIFFCVYFIANLFKTMTHFK